MPEMKKANRFARVKDVYGDDEDEGYDSRQYCQNCDKIGIRSKLMNRCYKIEMDKDGKPTKVPATVPDADKFRQCYHCGDIVPLYEVKTESKIGDFVETIDNPFDAIPGKMEGFTPGRKLNYSRSIYKRRRQYAESFKDDDIKREILKGNQVTIDGHNYQ